MTSAVCEAFLPRQTGKGNQIMDDYRRNYLDGNAARELPQRDDHLWQEPERESDRITESQERAGHQERTRKSPAREKQVVSLSAVAGFVLVAVLAVAVLSSHVRLNSIYAATVSQEKSLVQLEGEYSKLAAADEEIFDNESLKKVAEKHDLVKPKIGQQVYLELSDPNNTVVYNHPEEAAGLTGAVEWVKDLLGLTA